MQFSSATYSCRRTKRDRRRNYRDAHGGTGQCGIGQLWGGQDGTATGGAVAAARLIIRTRGNSKFRRRSFEPIIYRSDLRRRLAEISETIQSRFVESTGAVLGSPNTAVLTITDNDSCPTRQFSAATVSVSKEQHGNFDGDAKRCDRNAVRLITRPWAVRQRASGRVRQVF